MDQVMAMPTTDVKLKIRMSRTEHACAVPTVLDGAYNAYWSSYQKPCHRFDVLFIDQVLAETMHHGICLAE
jgi:hypothetical protein